MSLILHIETSTEICSVALGKEGALLALAESDASYSHARELTLLIESVLKEAGIQMRDLDAVAISAGPGSFTGLRIGTSTAKGICYALGKPLIAVDTLLSLADAMRDKSPSLLCPMIDARRMEVYTALYGPDLKPVWDTRALIVTPDAFDPVLSDGVSILLGGDGASKCMPLFDELPIRDTGVLCSAAHLIPFAFKAYQEGDFADTAYFTPNYFKSPNITKPKQKG